MSSYVSLEDQIQESRRGPRILGEFTMDLPVLMAKEMQANRLAEVEQPTDYVFKNFAIGNWLLYEEPTPFDLSLAEFLNLKFEEARSLHTTVYKLCKDLLEEAWKRGVKQVILCNGKIVYENRDNEDISNEVIEQIAKKYNRACYVFSSPDIVEESAWTPVDCEDFYPTIGLHIGPEDSDENQIVNKSPQINADFDTGNSYYRVFDANQVVPPLTYFTPLQIRQTEHLNKTYTYFVKRVKICAKDENGKIHSTVSNIRLVKDWKGSALLQASPNRIGFVGRNIMQDLQIRVELDPSKKSTYILNL